MITITIDGEPGTWKRAIPVASGSHARMVTPKVMRDQKRHIALLAMQARGVWMRETGRPWPLDAWYRCHVRVHTSTRRIPDTDRVSNLVLDALQGVLWANDRRVIEPHPSLVAVCDPQPRVVVFVAIIDPPTGWAKKGRTV